VCVHACVGVCGPLAHMRLPHAQLRMVCCVVLSYVCVYVCLFCFNTCALIPSPLYLLLLPPPLPLPPLP
jgi:hypothetical protein